MAYGEGDGEGDGDYRGEGWGYVALGEEDVLNI